MRVLGIDTTRKNARIFILDNEKEIKYSLQMGENLKHSEGLFLFIEKALFECKIKLEDMDVFCGVVGPGSFTGIRVGMSVLKAFNISCNKKLLPLNTFEIIASKYKSGYILLNSTATTCYYGKIHNRKLVEDGVIEKTKIADLLNGETAIILLEEQDCFDIEYNNIEFVKDISELYFDCLLKKLESCEEVEFLPYYLQLSQAERNVKSE